MQKRKYYLFYQRSDFIVDALIGPVSDITEIDLLTLEKTRDDFLKQKGILKTNDLFIGRITNHRDKSIEIKYYEPIFHEEANSKISLRLEESMKSLALERLQKIKNQESSIRLASYSEALKQFLTTIMKSIVSDYQTFSSFISLLPTSYIRDYFYQFYQKNDSFSQSKILQFLADYKSVRYLYFLFECVHYQRALPNHEQARDQYQFDSFIFDFYHSFPIYLHEVSEIPREFLPYQMALQDQTIQRILHSPFDSKEIERLYEIGGLEYVLNSMDTNQLYNSSNEDLLRLGIYSNEEYFKIKK